MLFNLSQQRHFPSLRATGKEIYCSSSFGPCFTGGDGNLDLSAWYEPFNGIEKCLSRSKKAGYGIPVEAAGLNMLTN